MYVEHLLDPLIKLTGLTCSEISFVISILFCYVNGYIFRTTFGVNKVSTITRHYVSIISGVTVLLFCFGSEIVHLVILTLVAHSLTKLINGKHVHKYIFAFSFTHNFIVHILQMLYGKKTVIDITAPMMFATLRIIYLGFTFYDISTNKDIGERQHYKSQNIENKEFPTLLEVISYMFFFSSILVGPPSSFQAYKDFIEGKDVVKTDQCKNPPSPLIPAVTKFFLGFAFVGGYLFFQSVNISPATFKDERLLTEYPFWKKIVYSELVVLWIKCKYYSVFYLGEACVNMAGFGFNGHGQHGNALWDGLINIKPIEFEKSQSMKDVTGNWNIQTAVWLRNCVYTRVSTLPMFATFLVSAVWHGPLFGLYIYFISLGIILYPQRMIRKKVLPLLEASKTLTWLHWAINFVIIRLENQYLNTAIVSRDMYATLDYWRAMHFFGHWIILGLYVVTFLLPDYRKIEKHDEKKKD